jgi:hypothetical protein
VVSGGVNRGVKSKLYAIKPPRFVQLAPQLLDLTGCTYAPRSLTSAFLIRPFLDRLRSLTIIG